MALQSVGSLVFIPAYWPSTLGGISVNTTTYLIDAAGEKVGLIFQVPQDGDITHIGFRTATVTTGDTLKVGLYNLDASGNPDTTSPYKGMVAGTKVVADTDDNTYFEVALATPATGAVKGDFVAIVIEYNAYVAGNMTIAGINAGGVSFGCPYGDLFTTAWTKQGTVGTPFVTIRYNGTYYPIPAVYPAGTSGILSVTYSVNTTPYDEYGIHINLPVPVRVVGAWMSAAISAGANHEVNLYQGTTVLKSLSVDGDYTAGISVVRPQHRMFSSPQTLSANVDYYLSIRPTTTANVTLPSLTVPSDAAAAQMHTGSWAYRVKRVDQGAWDTSDTTIFPVMGLIVDAFDDGSGGGSVSSIEINSPVIVAPFRSVGY